MSEVSEFDLRDQLRGIGIVNTSEQDNILRVARKCAVTGAVVGAGWAVVGAPALAPGAMVGFLSGFVVGTVTCGVLSDSAKEVLKKIGTGHLELR